MPALILAHPSSPVPILHATMREADPESRASILRAWRESNRERQALRDKGINVPLHPLPPGFTEADLLETPDPPFRKHDAMEPIKALVERYGAPTIKRLVKHVAHVLKGAEV